ncbi:hypothetical protein CEUSTIGMA_g5577.t1 [Chlamydomonas eustigma]|uniref:Uncharacterized protein n=1 Tax=Chlamydomonas eustigma TaxID=1157962 RepID=A0A250X4X8_9CHLO|nr:hypothetical protein CEUSTIGMA_g5577.t1 [Chlamydomonas eustigma]|eukprot:GAX78135.1 hypothetical protein CEUSTIGMA_g5577.t1 [Chlamydomonas eustigma]
MCKTGLKPRHLYMANNRIWGQFDIENVDPKLQRAILCGQFRTEKSHLSACKLFDEQREQSEVNNVFTSLRLAELKRGTVDSKNLASNPGANTCCQQSHFNRKPNIHQTHRTSLRMMR